MTLHLFSCEKAPERAIETEVRWPTISFPEPFFCSQGHELPNPSRIMAQWSDRLIYVACLKCRPTMCVPIEIEARP